MPTRAAMRNPARGRRPIQVAIVVTVVILPLRFTAHGGGFEPYYPTNEQLRHTIRGVWESQTFRPPAILAQKVREAMRSIGEPERRSDPRLAGLLPSRLKGAWAELERSRAAGALGYMEFDEQTFQAAEAKFQEALSQILGTRGANPEEGYRAALQTLDTVQALSRYARASVPGLSSDDVLLIREKRQRLLLKEAKGEEGMGVHIGAEAMPTR